MKKRVALALLSLSLFEGGLSSARPETPKGVDAGPPPQPLEAVPFPTERSKTPTVEEWRSAPLVAPARTPEVCRVYRVREWLKVRCSEFLVSGVGMMAGPSEGVAMLIDPPPRDPKNPDESPRFFDQRGVTLQFPASPGEGHVFQIFEFGDSYEGVGAPVVRFVVSEYWAPGEAAPVLVIR